MIEEDPQALFDRFLSRARDYLASPGMVAALELDDICMTLYPLVIRRLEDAELSTKIREFGRSLPRRDATELASLLDEIVSAAARHQGLVEKN